MKIHIPMEIPIPEGRNILRNIWIRTNEEHRSAIIFRVHCDSWIKLMVCLLHIKFKISEENRKSSDGDFNSPDICWKSHLDRSRMSNRSLT